MRGQASAIVTALAILAASAAQAEAIAVESQTSASVSPDTGLGTWETKANDVYVRLTQISPDQARGFMQARGLDEKSVDEYAHTCVFMTVLRNDGKHPVKFCLAEWRLIAADGDRQLILTKHDWMARWQPRKLSRPVSIAFEWSQFPVEQTFAPGDWNQGMTTYALPAGSHFDLLVRWWSEGKQYEEKLHDVACPASFD